MSKRAEEAGLTAYPFFPGPQIDLRDENPTDYNKIHRRLFIEGYEQAEKDLALTWEDIREICKLSVIVEFKLGTKVTDNIHYSEVLRRFNKQKNNVKHENN